MQSIIKIKMQKNYNTEEINFLTLLTANENLRDLINYTKSYSLW